MNPDVLHWITGSVTVLGWIFFGVIWAIRAINKQEHAWVPFLAIVALVLTFGPTAHHIWWANYPEPSRHILEEFELGEKYYRISVVNLDPKTKNQLFFVKATSDGQVFFTARPENELTPEHFIATKAGPEALTPNPEEALHIARDELHQRLLFQVNNNTVESSIIDTDNENGLEITKDIFVKQKELKRTVNGDFLELLVIKNGNKEKPIEISASLHPNPENKSELIGLINLNGIGLSSRLHILSATETKTTILIEKQTETSHIASRYNN